MPLTNVQLHVIVGSLANAEPFTAVQVTVELGSRPIDRQSLIVPGEYVVALGQKLIAIAAQYPEHFPPSVVDDVTIPDPLAKGRLN